MSLLGPPDFPRGAMLEEEEAEEEDHRPIPEDDHKSQPLVCRASSIHNLDFVIPSKKRLFLSTLGVQKYYTDKPGEKHTIYLTKRLTGIWLMHLQSRVIATSSAVYLEPNIDDKCLRFSP